MRNKIAIAAIMVLGVLAAIAGVAATGGSETRKFVEDLSPSEDANGMIDESKLPPTMGVMDSTGAVVGYVKKMHYQSDTFTYPLPVFGPDTNHIGHVGENGFWALGEPEPFSEGSYSVVEEFDENGELIWSEVILPIRPTPGEEYGPDGELISSRTIYDSETSQGPP